MDEMPLPLVEAAHGVATFQNRGMRTPRSFSLVPFFPLEMAILAPFMVALPVSGNGSRNERQRKSDSQREKLQASVRHGSAGQMMNFDDEVNGHFPFG